MYRIYKYKLDIADEQKIELPIWSEILSIIEQNNDIVMYVMVDDTIKKMSYKRFRIVGTGRPFPDHQRWKFFTTVPVLNGSLVWHIFIEI